MILNEFREYSNDIDLDLVIAAVKGIGDVILKVEKAVKRAVEIISEIVENGQEFALQEAVIVARNIFRKAPKKYTKLVGDLCEKMQSYTEPESKAAIIWIIGEYADKITNSEKLMQEFIETFLEEEDQVKLQILTACVKLYIKKPDDAEDLIQDVLKLATDEADNPDVRDRAYIYWRMLSTSP
mmetsp:Transcript_37108/g.27020  ORF Transcript_37108/g.27020 Transcript_37108/m.27020 type:complete len:183 (-) Transcript_37108:1630-2178(-)